MWLRLKIGGFPQQFHRENADTPWISQGVPNFHTEGIGQHSVRTGAKVSNGLDWLRGSTAWAADSDAAGGEIAASTAWCEMQGRKKDFVDVAGTKKAVA